MYDSKYKYLILDVYQTLYSGTNFYGVYNLLKPDMKPAKIAEAFRNTMFGLPYDLCNDPEIVIMKVSKLLNIPYDYNKICGALTDSIGFLNSDLQYLANIVHKTPGWRVGILSDCNAVYAQANHLHANKLNLDFCFNSCELGITKQDPLCYEFITNKLKCNPYDIIFIDDCEENCKLASEYGWKSYVYTNQDCADIVDGVKLLLE